MNTYWILFLKPKPTNAQMHHYRVTTATTAGEADPLHLGTIRPTQQDRASLTGTSTGNVDNSNYHTNA